MQKIDLYQKGIWMGCEAMIRWIAIGIDETPEFGCIGWLLVLFLVMIVVVAIALSPAFVFFYFTILFGYVLMGAIAFLNYFLIANQMPVVNVSFWEAIPVGIILLLHNVLSINSPWGGSAELSSGGYFIETIIGWIGMFVQCFVGAFALCFIASLVSVLFIKLIKR